MSYYNTVTNKARLTGLVSGMDTDTLVKYSTRLQQTKIDQQMASKTKMEWKVAAYNDITSSLRTFRDKYMSVLNQKTNLMSSHNYNTRKAEYVSKDNAMTLTATNNATVEYLRVVKAEMARGGHVEGTELDFGVGGNIDSNTYLFAAGIDFSGGSVSVSINGKEITFNALDTVGSAAARINEATGGAVSLTYNQLSKSFTLEAAIGAQDYDYIRIEDTSGHFFRNIGLINVRKDADGNTITDADGNAVYETFNSGSAKSAYIEVVGADGKLGKHTFATNEFTLAGVEFKLNHDTTESFDITIKQDVEPVFNLITEMVDAYNELFGKLQKYVNDKPNRAYTPLTDELRASMTEKEVEQWEEKAKAGILRNDSSVSRLMSDLRGVFFSPTYNLSSLGADSKKGNMLASFGIQTSYGALKGGQLEIDTVKLKKALADDPEAVMNAFMQNVNFNENVPEADKYKYNGAMTRIQNIMSSFDTTVTYDVVGALNTRINRAESSIYDLQIALYKKQESYYQKYAALEKAMQNMSSQSSWIAQQMGMSSGS